MAIVATSFSGATVAETVLNTQSWEAHIFEELQQQGRARIQNFTPPKPRLKTRDALSIELICDYTDIWIHEMPAFDRKNDETRKVGWYWSLNIQADDQIWRHVNSIKGLILIRTGGSQVGQSKQRTAPVRSKKVFIDSRRRVDEVARGTVAEEHTPLQERIRLVQRTFESLPPSTAEDDLDTDTLSDVLKITMTGQARPFTITTVNRRRHPVRV